MTEPRRTPMLRDQRYKKEPVKEFKKKKKIRRKTKNCGIFDIRGSKSFKKQRVISSNHFAVYKCIKSTHCIC